jgi:hypothetical protein
MDKSKASFVEYSCRGHFLCSAGLLAAPELNDHVLLRWTFLYTMIM